MKFIETVLSKIRISSDKELTNQVYLIFVSKQKKTLNYFRKRNLSMSTDDVSTTAVTRTKRPISCKHRILSHRQSREKSRTDEFRSKRTMTAINRPSSKLPNLLAKGNICPSASGSLFLEVSRFKVYFPIESMQSRRYHSPQRDRVTSSSAKLERTSTTINPQTRLPVLYSLTNDEDQKGISEFRRRQVCFIRDLFPRCSVFFFYRFMH
jgi:hypothetical protein